MILPPMTLRSTIRCLLLASIALPIAHLVLVWVGGLLAAMGDRSGAAVLGHLGTAIGVMWALALVGLVIVLALKVLDEPPQER
jgi:hypothetical protein